jgi:hypothetical protein
MSTLDDMIRDGIEACEFRDVGSSYATELVIQGSLNWMHRWLNPNDEQAVARADVVIAVAHPRRPRSPRVDRIDQSVGDASERNSDRRCVQVTPRNVEFLRVRLTHRRNLPTLAVSSEPFRCRPECACAVPTRVHNRNQNERRNRRWSTAYLMRRPACNWCPR